MTATGRVCWSDARPRRRQLYPLGVEWLPLEETARQRLRDLLQHAPRGGAATKPSRRLFAAGLGLGMLLACWLAIRMLWLQRAYQQLQLMLQ